MLTSPGLDLPHAWTTLDEAGRLIAALVVGGLGLILAFYGFRLFRGVLVLTGAVLGAHVGLLLTGNRTLPAPLPTPLPEQALNASAATVATAVGNTTRALWLGGPVAAWLVPIGLALIGAALLWGLYRLGALLFGAALGMALLGSIGTRMAVSTDVGWVLRLVGAIGGALLGWSLQVLVLIVTTAIFGGWSTAGAMYLFLHRADPGAAATIPGWGIWGVGPSAAGGPAGLPYLFGALLLALLGAIFQARDHARRRERSV